MSRFRVRFTLEAEADLLQLFDFLLEQDISAADRAEAAIAKALARDGKQLRIVQLLIDLYQEVGDKRALADLMVRYLAPTDPPEKRFEPVSERAICRYMKMITLPKLRDSLRDWKHVVTVPPETAARARQAIERMVAIA